MSLTAPAAGSTHPTGVPLTISATASDNVGVTRVEFYRSTSPLPIASDTTPPYTISWTPQGIGQVALTAKAYDGCHTRVSAPHTITVAANPCLGDTQGPSVAITWPEPGNLYILEANEVRATASDPNGVDHVEFFIDFQGGYVDSAAPWQAPWLDPQPGPYYLMARAVDGCGNPRDSAYVDVTVTSSPTPDLPPDP